MNHFSLFSRSTVVGLILFLTLCAYQAFAVTVNIQLRDSDGEAVADAGTATLKVYDNGWSTLTNNNGDWTYSTNSATVKFKMYYNNGIQEKTVSTSTSTVVFNTVTVTPALKSSDDTELSGGRLKYYQNGWSGYKTANVAIEMLAGTYKFKMYYNNGIEYKNNHAIDGDNDDQEVLFQTVTVTPALKSSDDTELSGGRLKYYQNGWSGYKTANVAIEMLAGTYKFKMYYNNGIEYKNNHDIDGNNDDQVVLFQTVTVTPALKPSNGPALDGGQYKFYQNGWSGYKTANETIEMLAGTYKFKMYYNNGIEYKNNHAIDGDNDAQEVLFQTVTVTPALKNSDGTPLTGGRLKFYQNGWSGYKTANVDIEMLAGTYKFKMYYNNGIEYKNNHAIDGNNNEQVVLFQTTTVTHKLTNCDNGDVVDGGEVKHYQNGWSGKNAANTEIEYLPGSYKFKMYYKNGIEYQNNVAVSGDSYDVEFFTRTVDYNYAETVRFYQNGWRTHNGPEEILAGTYKFKFGTFQQFITIPNCQQISTLSDDQNTFALTGNVYIFKVKNEAGEGIADVPIKWHHNTNYNNTWTNLGTTDANGMLFSIGDVWKTGSQPFKAVYNKTSQTKSTEDNAEFQTTVATALVQNCDQEPVPGVLVEFLWHSNYTNDGYRLNVGTTGNDGKASIELFPGEYKFRATINHTKSEQTFDLAPNVDVDVEFNPTVVDLDYAGTVKWKYNNYYYTDVTDDYLMFPGTYKFKFSGVNDFTGIIDLDIEGCEFGSPVYIFEVVNEDGEGIAGVPIEWHYNTNYSNTWKDIGTTDADGMLYTFGDVTDTGNEPFRAKYNATYQTISTVGYAKFETTVATALVEDCDNNPISGVNVDFLWHGNYTGSNWRINLGSTGTDGKASIEIFPGNHKFEARLNHTTSVQTFDLVANEDVDVEFNPTKVNFNYAGNVKWKYNNYYYTDVTDDYLMFPGTYKFKFSGVGNFTGTHTMDVSGCEMEKAPIFVQLKSSSNVGLPNSSYQFRFGYGGYTNIGTDNTGDGLFYFIDGNPSNTKVKISYKGASIERQQNVRTNPNFIFTTRSVTSQLLESDDNNITSNATWHFRYGYGSYQSFTQGMELLPVNTKIRCSYSGTSVEKQQNVNSDQSFTFRTKPVTSQLLESDYDNITSNATWHFRYGYGSYQSFTQGMELLPVNTKIRCSYRGISVEKQQNVNSDQLFTFRTKSVSAELKNSSDGFITSGVSYDFRYGYGSYQSFTQDMELLPVNTKIRCSYRGTSVEKQQNVNSDQTFSFKTAKANPTLTNSSDNSSLTNDATFKYRYGYATARNFPSDGELLPVNTKFYCYYNNSSKEKAQTLSTANSPNDIPFTWDGSNLYKQANFDIADSWNGVSSKSYPNPFDSDVNINYSISFEANVKIEIYNMQGQLVKTLLNENQSEGDYSVIWDGYHSSGMPAESGVYIYKINAGEFAEKGMITLAR